MREACTGLRRGWYGWYAVPVTSGPGTSPGRDLGVKLAHAHLRGAVQGVGEGEGEAATQISATKSHHGSRHGSATTGRCRGAADQNRLARAAKRGQSAFAYVRGAPSTTRRNAPLPPAMDSSPLPLGLAKRRSKPMQVLNSHLCDRVA